MAIAFRAAGTSVAATSGNLASVGLPAGHTTNDILCLVVEAGDNVDCSVTGYTRILAQSNSASSRTEIWIKRDGGSETAPTVTHTAGADAIAVLFAVSGVDPGLTIGSGAGAAVRDIQVTTGTDSPGSGSAFTPTAPACSGGVAADLDVCIAGAETNDTSGVSGDAAGIFAQPTSPSYTERKDCAGGGLNFTVGIGIGSVAGAGSGSLTWGTCDWLAGTGGITHRNGIHMLFSSDVAGGAGGTTPAPTLGGPADPPWQWQQLYGPDPVIVVAPPSFIPALTRPPLRGVPRRRPSIVHAKLLPPPPRPPDALTQPRRLRGIRPRRTTIVHAFLQPPPPRAPDAPSQQRRLRGLLVRRTRIAAPPIDQVRVVDAPAQTRRLRGMLARRARIVHAKLLPPPPRAPDAPTPRRIHGAFYRRAKYAEPTWPQVQPPAAAFPSNQAANQPRRLRGLLVRRGRRFDVPLTQAVPPPTYLPAAVAPRRLHGALARRPQRYETPPPQATPPAPPTSTPRRRGALGRRAKTSSPIFDQATPPPTIRLRLRVRPRRRPNRFDVPLTQAVPPPPPRIPDATRARRIRLLFTRRAKKSEPTWPQAPIVVGTILVGHGQLQLRSGTGELEERSSTGQLELRSGTGELEERSSTGQLELRSGTGELKGEL